ncbi:hypothetical protein KP79_PYT19547 [Mizuhopecten yessoensis]|uniref:Cysteine-rich transmembrane CYSTM domain-containing protein n=1 Tax=Mizuhopecten yessoensis TaxID=6573 RepID=A0A210R3B0_MIZYE|nr:hypothetical protein KP79_PYT19547 [Mizuhopecten yessoensis]
MSQPTAPPYAQYPPAYSILSIPDQRSHINQDRCRNSHRIYQTTSDIGYTRPQQAIYPSNRMIHPGYFHGNQPLPGQATSYPPRHGNEPIFRRTTIEKEESGRVDNVDVCIMAVLAAVCCCFLCSNLED